MSKTSKILLVAVLSTFMVILDQTIMNTALPHIIAVFNETADRAQLIVSAYLMATAITTPLAPFLADRYGIKRVFMGSQIGFLAGSVLCGISWDIQSLIFFRVLQGLAGGLLVPLSMSFLFVNMPPENRGTAMGIFGIPMLLAPAIGPTLGGYLVDFWSWRVVYYINVPVVIVAFAMAYTWIQDTAVINTKFDYKGFALASVGFSSILYAFSYAPTWHWDDWRIITLLVVGCTSILAWVIIELTQKNPMLDLRMLAIRDYAFGIGLSFVTTLGLFSLEFLLPLFLQTLRGLSAFQSGLMVLFQALGAMISMPVSGRLYDRIGPRIPAVFGLALMGVTSLWMQVLDVNTPDEMLRIILILRGAGLGMTMMPIMTYALSSVPSSMAAQASSVLTVLRTIVASLGVAVFATLLDGFQKTNLAMMVQTVTPDSPLALRAISQIQAYLMQSGMSADVAYRESIVLLYQSVNLRASVTAFDTDYVIGAIVILVSIIPAFFLPTGRVKRAGGPSGIPI
jgi:EmrB/QacA subfamily drug resistance transporter